MKANELRINNLVFVRGEARRVTSITNTSINTLINGCNFAEVHFSPEDVSPIPLTEEWLLKFGFTKIAERNFKKDFYTVFIRDFSISISNNHGYLANIKYVHQLQNLYFALTGEELKFL